MSTDPFESEQRRYLETAGCGDLVSRWLDVSLATGGDDAVVPTRVLDHGDGSPVVLVHGDGRLAAAWAPLMAASSRWGRRVLGEFGTRNVPPPA